MVSSKLKVTKNKLKNDEPIMKFGKTPKNNLYKKIYNTYSLYTYVWFVIWVLLIALLVFLSN